MRLCILISLLLSLEGSAQYVSQWSLDALRIGIDPIRSWSMLANAEKYKDRPVFFNFVEGYAEFLIHLRTSAVVELGYSNSHWNRFSNTFFYNSKGYFGRVGLDFNVSEPDPDYEVDLGWRLGLNSFHEKGDLALQGNYWGERINTRPLDSQGSTFWGEILLDMKYRLFRHSHSHVLGNLWMHFSVRFRFKQRDLRATQEHQYFMIPGYGFNNRYMGGVHFTLSYFIKIRERKIYRIHHVYDNKVLMHHR